MYVHIKLKWGLFGIHKKPPPPLRVFQDETQPPPHPTYINGACVGAVEADGFIGGSYGVWLALELPQTGLETHGGTGSVFVVAESKHSQIDVILFATYELLQCEPTF